MAGLETASGDVTTYRYTPSPMDNSLLVPQLFGLAVLALCVAYVQFVLNPTARIKFNTQDEVWGGASSTAGLESASGFQSLDIVQRM